ncbi:hypothetical protein [Agrobacterium tumefaciens]|uniref:hypothetical protein n=1 Tax=Agrobacterium tumefaciens TaxID=358 RepID=UPI001F2F9220|nr:hypothetical protein [Agrobacterium tumefaciens]
MVLRKEATARININRLLEAAGWRFFDDKSGPANVILEPNVKLKPEHIERLGADFEKCAKGFIDFLLLGNEGKPLIVLEAKSEDKDPRTYMTEASREGCTQPHSSTLRGSAVCLRAIGAARSSVQRCPGAYCMALAQTVARELRPGNFSH